MACKDLTRVLAQMEERRLRENLEDPNFVKPIEEGLERLYVDPNRMIIVGTEDTKDLNKILAIKVIYIDNRHDDPPTIMYIAGILDYFGTVTSSSHTGEKTSHSYVDDMMTEQDEEKKISLCKRAGDRSLFEVAKNPTSCNKCNKRLKEVIWTGRMGYRYLAKGESARRNMRRVYGELDEANNFYVDMMRQIGNLLIGQPSKQMIKRLHDDALIDSKTSLDGNVREEAGRRVLMYEEILRKSRQDK